MKRNRIILHCGLVIWMVVFAQVDVFGDSKPTTLPTSKPSAVGSAVKFLAGLRDYLRFQQKNSFQYTQADAMVHTLLPDISNVNVEKLLTPYGLKLSSLTDEKILLVKRSLADGWGAAVNFYKDVIDFQNPREGVIKSAGENRQVVFFSAHRKGFRPVRIMVWCVWEKSEWKIHYLMVLPENKNVEQVRPD